MLEILKTELIKYIDKMDEFQLRYFIALAKKLFNLDD